MPTFELLRQKILFCYRALSNRRSLRMDSSDSLMLDAKQAILEEQHRRFQVLQKEGKWAEAMQQFQTTMHCASDLLSDSLNLLERVIKTHRQGPPENPPQ
jgi:hypothetical protein